tara:strand:+ start:1928 stop:2431 length:504 start_codon:yes stop_codon:yes gene_type:complete
MKRIFSSVKFNQLTIRTIVLCLFVLLCGCANEYEQIYEKKSKKTFANVIQDAEFAITENNFRITNRLHIGKAIKERGNIDFPQNEVILFCNLTIAEEMLRIEPRYINYCPYKVTVTDSNEYVTIATRLLPLETNNSKMSTVFETINKILRSVVEYAASEDPFILDKI